MYHSFINQLNIRWLHRIMNKIEENEEKTNREFCTITFLHYLCIPERIAKPLKQHLIHYFSRKRYYEYHNGTRPVPREHEQHILQAAKNYGWDKPIAFNSYIEDYLW